TSAPIRSTTWATGPASRRHRTASSRWSSCARVRPATSRKSPGGTSSPTTRTRAGSSIPRRSGSSSTRHSPVSCRPSSRGSSTASTPGSLRSRRLPAREQRPREPEGHGGDRARRRHDGRQHRHRAPPTFLIPAIQSAYANLQTANSPLVDATTHPSLEAAVTVLGEWLAYLGDPSQIYPGVGHYAAAYSPSRGQPGMSIFYQWWYALKKNLWGGGMSPGEPFVGTVNFSDTSIDGGDYLDETTYNMFLPLLEGLTAGVPQHFTGDYFGGHRDEIIIESLNDAILELSGTAPLPRRGYGLC